MSVSRLPKFISQFFWEYDPTQLSWQSDRDLIISRILFEGDWRSISWLRRQLTSEELKDWVVSRRGRGFDPRQLRFWELVLDIPRQSVNEWLHELNADVWQQRVIR